MNKIKAFLIAMALGASTQACGGPAGEICDLAQDCERFNDADYDKCVVDYEAAIDIAYAYGCDAEADDLADCIIEDADCDGDDFDYNDDCGPEVVDLAVCIDRGSSLDNN